MKIAINRKIYDCNTKAIAPIRFRSFFGFSFLNEYTKDGADEKDLLVKLLYIAINNPDLPFSEFQKDCAEDENFLSSALFVQADMFGFENIQSREATEETAREEFDEFIILAQMAFCGIPERLLDELNLFQITKVIKYCLDMKNPSQKPKVLSEKERKSIFGITPEVEERIRLAIERGEE